ncbi:hypothetical protein [Sinomicrobium sp. M5D2P9]
MISSITTSAQAGITGYLPDTRHDLRYNARDTPVLYRENITNPVPHTLTP